MLIRRTQEDGLIELKFGRDKGSVYADKVIPLPHKEYLLFEGYVLNLGMPEDRYFQEFFKDGNNIQDLLRNTANWDGCWSIVYINANGTAYCFTDPLGKKQLYYNTRGDISTEIRPIVDENDYRIDDFYIAEIYKWGYNIDNRTPFADVKRILPNLVYVFVGSNPLPNMPTTPYYDFSWYGGKMNGTNFRNLVRASVLNYLQGVGNAPSIGVLLSGGLDSSVIALELLGLQRGSGFLPNTRLDFYTINNKDDAPFVKIFADRFDIEVTTLSYDMSTVDLGHALFINETPVDLGSMIPNQKMFVAIPNRIIFTGDGPDEMFGGYRRIDEYDSQKSDIFHELSFYHLPRLDKAASYYGKELRCPWLSYDILRYALSLPYEERKHKECIKNAYRGILPDEIIDRPKLPLKNDELRADPMAYRKKVITTFLEMLQQK